MEMKTLHLSIIGGIGCIIFGISGLIYAIVDYEYRIYAYRYLPSPCKPGSGCPYPGWNDNLVWLGIGIVVVGIILLLYRKIKHGKNNRK